MHLLNALLNRITASPHVLAATVGAAGIVGRWLPREAAYGAQVLFWLAVLDGGAVAYHQHTAARR